MNSSPCELCGNEHAESYAVVQVQSLRSIDYPIDTGDMEIWLCCDCIDSEVDA
jgi:hypothetical protein